MNFSGDIGQYMGCINIMTIPRNAFFTTLLLLYAYVHNVVCGKFRSVMLRCVAGALHFDTLLHWAVWPHTNRAPSYLCVCTRNEQTVPTLCSTHRSLLASRESNFSVISGATQSIYLKFIFAKINRKITANPQLINSLRTLATFIIVLSDLRWSTHRAITLIITIIVFDAVKFLGENWLSLVPR